MTITKTEAAAMLEAIKANRVKIDGCPKHRFDIGEPPYKFGAKYPCTNCGGTMDAVQAFRYTQGYKAAGGNPNDVIPGYECEHKSQKWSIDMKNGTCQDCGAKLKFE